MIQELRTVSEVCVSRLEEYEVEPERCERELLVLQNTKSTGQALSVSLLKPVAYLSAS